MEFEEVLAKLGFYAGDERAFARRGRLYESHPNTFMTYTVHAFDDGSAIFSWEFALGDYLLTKGIQFGSDETLNQFAYPRHELHGPQEGAWLAVAIEQAEAQLADVRLDRPEA
jgi:hypothetical protein